MQRVLIYGLGTPAGWDSRLGFLSTKIIIAITPKGESLGKPLTYSKKASILIRRGKRRCKNEPYHIEEDES